MKKITVLLILLLFPSGILLGEVLPTFTFKATAYTKTTSTDSETALRSKPVTFLVILDETQTLDDINILVSKRDIIGQHDPDQLFKDIPTSEDASLYNDIISPLEFDRLGTQSYLLYDELTLNNIRHARIILNEYSYEDDGHIYANDNFYIYQNGNLVSPENLYKYETVLSDSNNKNQSYNYSQSAGAIYLIVTSSELADAFIVLALYRKSLGIETELVLIDDILNGQNGIDDAEKLRNYLKEFYNSGGEYVLLGGDETILPIRYAYHNIAYSTPSLYDQQICDLYFADLTGNWDVDGDLVYGEKYVDSADITPELKVGRLPFNSPVEVTNYVNKLIAYETNPGNGDYSYLEKTFFVSTDQMRDYPGGGQHCLITQAYPDYFCVDTVSAVEQIFGDDLDPINLFAPEVEPIISSGFGIINILSHGSNSSFGIRSSGYNNFPKSSFITDTTHPAYGIIQNLEANGNVSFYYSLACDNGSFDKDQQPFNQSNPNLAQTLLGLDRAGAVGFVAHSRWGWVSSSHNLQRTFFDSLFAHPERPAIEAMYEMKQTYYYHRDQVYGINFLGDPLLKVYTTTPEKINLSLDFENGSLTINTSNGSGPLADCRVIVSLNGNILEDVTTNNSGKVRLNFDFNLNENHKITASKQGYTVSVKDFNPSISTDIEQLDYNELPLSFQLYQNYPNPFNPNTTIRFDLPASSNISLKIYNIRGQKVRTLIDEFLLAGSYQVEWQGLDDKGQDIASGVYFYRLAKGETVLTKKMLLLK